MEFLLYFYFKTSYDYLKIVNCLCILNTYNSALKLKHNKKPRSALDNNLTLNLYKRSIHSKF